MDQNLPTNPVFSARPKSIFPTMTALARQYDAINLGQGFPDEDGPREILEVAAEALLEGPNQYAPIEGIPTLRQAVAEDNKRFYNLDINPDSETMICSGATEGLASVFWGLLQPGDEVILFAPFYECYAPQIEATGATVKYVSLQPPEWQVSADALEAAITSKTRMIVINTPHNPLGTVMSMEELEIIAGAARHHNLVVVCDEVYEHLVFEGSSHIPLMTLPGMFERCLRIGSAGKSFSLTGFRIGYITGPDPLITAVKKAHQVTCFSAPVPLQLAVAHALQFTDDYYQKFTSEMQQKRDLLSEGLRSTGLTTFDAQGTYFLICDITSVGFEDDVTFCETITKEAGVTAVPVSAFYDPSISDIPRHFARFCFCKKHDVLKAAVQRLTKYF